MTSIAAGGVATFSTLSYTTTSDLFVRSESTGRWLEIPLGAVANFGLVTSVCLLVVAILILRFVPDAEYHRIDTLSPEQRGAPMNPKFVLAILAFCALAIWKCFLLGLPLTAYVIFKLGYRRVDTPKSEQAQ
jgi:hypothetical protein